MNSTKAAVSFDEIIQADRKRKQNEALANEIFGRSRQTSDSSKNAPRKPSQTPSLASRVGVAKRSSSSTNVKTPKNNPFNPPSRPSSAASQIARTNRIASAINNARQANVVATQPRPSAPGPGLSIRGTAGPFVVEASNFAPGTTAADIESALQSVAVDSNGANGLTSCRIMSGSPTVIAEMVFMEKHIADNVIETFNNQKADGRILHVYLKRSGPGSAPALQSRKSETVFVPDTTPTPSNKDLFGDSTSNAEMEDIEMATDAAPPVYDNAREAADRDRRDRESRRAEPDVQDGRYGFSNTKDDRTQPTNNVPAQAPSQPREDRNDGVATSSIRRDGERDHGRDRDRDRDRDRERRYDDHRYDSHSRDDRGRGLGSYRRNDRPDNFDSRGGGGRPSHYGNGVGGRGGYPSGGGRMYSDDMMRGGSRGGVRGGYRGYR